MENINEHDMTRQMLDKLRADESSQSLSEPSQPIINKSDKDNLDEHDMTRQILGTIRESNTTKSQKTLLNILTEATNDVVKVEGEELNEEAQKFIDTVGGVDFKQYEVYPFDKNVVLTGVLDNGIEFKFSKKEMAPYINAQNVRLDSDTVEIVKRLYAYYVNWSQEWASKISEYTQSV